MLSAICVFHSIMHISQCSQCTWSWWQRELSVNLWAGLHLRPELVSCPWFDISALFLCRIWLIYREGDALWRYVCPLISCWMCKQCHIILWFDPNECALVWLLAWQCHTQSSCQPSCQHSFNVQFSLLVNPDHDCQHVLLLIYVASPSCRDHSTVSNRHTKLHVSIASKRYRWQFARQSMTLDLWMRFR